jgi:hypothetical protein
LPLNSSIFKNSNILTQDQSVELLTLTSLNAQNINASLIYKASRDGFTSDAFHLNCDNSTTNSIGKFVIIKTLNSNLTFGGFTQASWSGLGFDSDPNAFIFTLTNQPLLINCFESDYAVFKYSQFGPVFGGGFDLFVSNQSNLNTNSYLNLATSYPSSVYNSTIYFQSYEIEVYSISCLNNKYGLKCQSSNLNSSIFPNSTILNQQDSVDLLKLINFNSPKNKFKLLYQASQAGFNFENNKLLEGMKYEEDGIPNRFVVIKTSQSYVFGGYGQTDWPDKLATQNSFIYSFKNHYNIPTVMNNKRTDFFDPNRFFFGVDISIANNANTNMESFYQLGFDYELPFNFIRDTIVANSFLAGSTNFQPTEIEIYQLDRNKVFNLKNFTIHCL